ncbi:MAG: protein kinase [Chloroflexales bacterium]|nr:protein kinase [Chloroflexales bacterium]
MSQFLTIDSSVTGTLSDYRVLAMVGRGGMGAVYRVMRLADHTLWALKEMCPTEDMRPVEDADQRRLFLQEAELLRTLTHANLPAVSEIFVHDGRPCIVMEFVVGQTLDERIRIANAALAAPQVISVCIQVARVLHYMHTQNPAIIYRDVKPSNIMLRADRVIKLIDFGVARTYKKRQTKDTVAMGSAGYAPPEQYGKGQTDARSDVYGLGATLLHLLTNITPVPLHQPTVGSIKRLNVTVSSELELVIIRAMEQDPAKRYQTADQMAEALLACLDETYVDPTIGVTPPAIIPAGHTDGIQICAGCGHVNRNDSRFCSSCGMLLGTNELRSVLLIVASPRGSHRVRLDRYPARIGRRDAAQRLYPEIDLADYDRGVASRNHALITEQDGVHMLEDLASLNGTALNGKIVPAHQPQRLRPGDRIRIGEVEIEFRWE